MKKMLLLLMFVLTGCAKQYVIVNEYENSFLFYAETEEFEYREVIKLIEDDVYYNIYFNRRYMVEYDGKIYQEFDEIKELITLIGADELYNIGYRMERIPLERNLWERNFDMEHRNQ